jgi:xanthine dehydrogenase small subunit
MRFLLGNEIQELSGFDPQMTVLEWLRTQARRTGTKEGCAEGDCGACTVAVGELSDGRVRYQSFNSCIQLLPSLDGKQLVTVEDLADTDPTLEQLHPVQKAMVEQHGSQCGFCTPGFVMSLFTLFHQENDQPPQRQKPQRHKINQAIAGNLCRCTGYAPIVKAASQALSHAPEDKFHEQRKQVSEQLSALRRSEDLQLHYQGRRYFAPRSLSGLWALLDEHPTAQMVAGATDLGLWVTKQLREFETLISVCEVQEFKQIKLDATNHQIRMGAAVSYSAALDILVEHYPGMHQMLVRLGAEQVRNAGTIGGNIANGSPIGDMPPALIALGARLIVSSSRGRREMPLEAFFLEYGKQDLQDGECVEAVVVPMLQPNQHFSVYKVSKRFDQDISALCGGFQISLDANRVADARICFGGMAGTPSRARSAEQALIGQPWVAETVNQAMSAMQQDYTPLTDWRASADYRMLAAQNLLQRFYLETSSAEPVRLVVESGL